MTETQFCARNKTFFVNYLEAPCIYFANALSLNRSWWRGAKRCGQRASFWRDQKRRLSDLITLSKKTINSYLFWFNN